MFLQKSLSQTNQCVTGLCKPAHLIFSSSLFPDVQSDPMGLFLGAEEVHVVGNEELACPGDCSSPGGAECGRTIVRGPLCHLQLRTTHTIIRSCDTDEYITWLVTVDYTTESDLIKSDQLTVMIYLNYITGKSYISLVCCAFDCSGLPQSCGLLLHVITHTSPLHYSIKDNLNIIATL